MRGVFFSGSGIAERMLKKYSESLIVNDLQNYSKVINSSEYPLDEYAGLRKKIKNLAEEK